MSTPRKGRTLPQKVIEFDNGDTNTKHVKSTKDRTLPQKVLEFGKHSGNTKPHHY
ncbi:hypothetical protein Leryth_013847 [Lithospermum erythrorhizon]|nr:hypothetical protein Leryth_013847 [Lithospermum erythrorhizon]